jgi:hypothetical protein
VRRGLEGEGDGRTTGNTIHTNATGANGEPGTVVEAQSNW